MAPPSSSKSQFRWPTPMGKQLGIRTTLHIPKRPAIEEDASGKYVVWSPREIEIRDYHFDRYGPPLDDFLELNNAEEEKFINFIQKWGILDLCREHARPCSHNPKPDEPFLLKWAASEHCTNWGWYSRTHKCNIDAEPLYSWRFYVEQAYDMLRFSCRIWEDGISDIPDSFRREYPKIIKPKQAKGLIPLFINTWLMWGNVRLNLDWTERECRTPIWLRKSLAKSRLPLFPPQHPIPAKLDVSFVSPGLFGVLAFQLFLAISRINDIALCSSCGAPYLPERQVAKGRRNFCRQCGHKAAVRMAHKDFKQRNKQ